MEKLTLKSVEVIFANLEDEGFGKSITINCSDKEVRDAITKWVKDNKIGKGEKAGMPNIKEYEGKQQYALKLNDYTVFGFREGLDKSNLGFGATISLTAQAFSYDNKFGKGTSGALSAVYVESRAKTGADEDLQELMGSMGANDRLNDAPPPTDDDAPISLEDIPF